MEPYERLIGDLEWKFVQTLGMGTSFWTSRTPPSLADMREAEWKLVREIGTHAGIPLLRIHDELAEKLIYFGHHKDSSLNVTLRTEFGGSGNPLYLADVGFPGLQSANALQRIVGGTGVSLRAIDGYDCFLYRVDAGRSMRVSAPEGRAAELVPYLRSAIDYAREHTPPGNPGQGFR